MENAHTVARYHPPWRVLSYAFFGGTPQGVILHNSNRRKISSADCTGSFGAGCYSRGRGCSDPMDDNGVYIAFS